MRRHWRTVALAGVPTSDGRVIRRFTIRPGPLPLFDARGVDVTEVHGHDPMDVVLRPVRLRVRGKRLQAMLAPDEQVATIGGHAPDWQAGAAPGALLKTGTLEVQYVHLGPGPNAWRHP